MEKETPKEQNNKILRKKRIEEDSTLYCEAMQWVLLESRDLKRIVNIWLQIIDNPNQSGFVGLAIEHLRRVDPTGELQKEIREDRKMIDPTLKKTQQEVARRVKVKY